MTETVNRIFKTELKRLGLKRYDVARELGMSYPSLKTKVDDPNRFTFGDLKTLAELGINLKLELFYDTRFSEKDV